MQAHVCVLMLPRWVGPSPLPPPAKGKGPTKAHKQKKDCTPLHRSSGAHLVRYCACSSPKFLWKWAMHRGF